ncbi:stage II sporulation protein P [Lysinibacillus sp. 2017]|uniref:stage II sporulation protein P n=1 Tax=unclassified Lysinibacillus TaxID=2636778 RepID=UPI000D5265A8|nr:MULTISPECIES: stage II sporulation protein P [unclassified Lysinibacillus]AWE08109.1 stage II sporulation protein P [Lysinibacillus sp. 2017]TGN36387.1 stage II sporulation protein P [Lysinibacillus sp. S2017]
MQKLKRFSLLFLFLFTLPIAIGQLPFPNNEFSEKPKEPAHVVYAASQVLSTQQPLIQTNVPFHVLMLYTHSHESYKPVVAQSKGLQEVYDDQTNIYSMQQMMQHYFQLNQITSSVVDFDVMTELKSTGAKMYQAYGVMRPVLATKLSGENYDLVIDFHRDSATSKVTTLESNGERFAKIAFVVGAKHAGYEANLTYATALSEQLNRMMPGISRGVIKKEGEGVNGVYNQDLSPKMVLIELGGIDNTKEEIERTMAILAQAIRKAFMEITV